MMINDGNQNRKKEKKSLLSELLLRVPQGHTSTLPSAHALHDGFVFHTNVKIIDAIVACSCSFYSMTLRTTHTLSFKTEIGRNRVCVSPPPLFARPQLRPIKHFFSFPSQLLACLPHPPSKPLIYMHFVRAGEVRQRPLPQGTQQKKEKARNRHLT